MDGINNAAKHAFGVGWVRYFSMAHAVCCTDRFMIKAIYRRKNPHWI
jgi:hypothetical protein